MALISFRAMIITVMRDFDVQFVSSLNKVLKNIVELRVIWGVKKFVPKD